MEASDKPTATPWLFDGDSYSLPVVVSVNEDDNGGFVVCELFGPSAMPNGELIAKMGELLDLLEEFLRRDYGEPARLTEVHFSDRTAIISRSLDMLRLAGRLEA